MFEAPNSHNGELFGDVGDVSSHLFSKNYEVDVT
jgi:hypothetical protein